MRMPMFAALLLAGALAVGAAADAAAQEGPAQPVIPAHGLDLPGSFSGELPCADCEGIRWQLDLWPDQVFHLRRDWLGTDGTDSAIGRWSIRPAMAGPVLILPDGTGQPIRFEIGGREQLRLLDRAGRPIESDLPYELTRAEELRPVEPALGLQGLFIYFADAARLTECRTGRSYPVAMEGDYLALERAYLAAGVEPGAPLTAVFDGRIAERPPMEGPGPVPTVVVDRFVGVWEGERCPETLDGLSLTGAYWRILRLGGESIEAQPGHREPHLVFLDDEEARFAGTVGCNQLVGGYETDGPSLGFSRGASTMMACPPPLDDYERRLHEALEATAGWRITGRALELTGADGRTVALLRAAYRP